LDTRALRRRRLAIRAWRIIRRTSLEPAKQRLSHFAVLREKLAARVRRRSNVLRDQHRLIRQREIDPTPDLLTRQPEIVTFRIVSKERQPESILAARRPVTATRVTSRLQEDRHHIAPERHL